ncbi:hypothetical protein GWI33_015332 [Rhynchophorus ferrugineus]|uniref:Protein brunelleschi n=1 Tax=Rhynchophorus ferrugineus TaxID=354439 RepID=A0A834I5M2_RHYFE|nr:hypothetical protein GWI33_015332 [Rhynchophorus ferrugineus]
MRSSVSYILSTGPTEPNMSHPDYEQFSHDHAALLILLKHIGAQLKPKIFNKFYDRISKINEVKVTDSTGQVRNILVRFIKEHPVENNDWGDFQTHRRLLGLVSLGKYDSQVELNEVCRVHESLKVKYNATLYDSRCILFGPAGSIDDPEKEHFTTPSNFKTRALFYDELSVCADLEQQITEFISALFWVLESKRLERSREKLERVSLLYAPFEKKDFVGLDMESRQNKKRCTGRMTKHLGDLCLQAGLISECLQYYTNAADILKSVNDWLWLGGAFEGLSAASALVLYPNMQRNEHFQRIGSLPEGSPKKPSMDTLQNQTVVVKKNIPNVLSPDDIAKRYREAIIHYSKYQNAGIIETEASFKAARISVEQNHALQAASFLQNVVYINLSLSEQEKIQRFETLSDLYTQIGFNRKAAFCLRLAATRYVSQQNPSPNWNRCYALMLQSLSGHKLILDPVEMIEADQGWPILQVQILQDLIVAAKRAGYSALATRHMTFLLQTMWHNLSDTEQKELSIQLQGLSVQCEGSPVPLVFTLRDLKPHLRPKVIEKEKEDTGPFLFTPIHFGTGSLDRRRDKTNPKMEFVWVENEVCEVTLKLVNPLPFELKVSNMRLLTSGVVFESIPETVVLAPDVPTSLTLSGWARESGELEITGYSTHALGVKSNCRLKYMSNSFPSQYKVDVAPNLPVLQASTSLPQSASFSNIHDDNIVTSASVSLYHGETVCCTITLTNTSQIPIEMLDVLISSGLEPMVQDQIFQFDQEDVKIILPLLPAQSATFTVKIYGAANFLAPNSAASPTIPNEYNSGFFSSMSTSLPGTSLSRVNSSFRSSNSGHSSLAGGLTTLFQQQPGSSTVEAQLKLRYSGGGGLQAQYCRISTVFFMVELLPSLHVTNWDVLPAETSTQFYLVLDIVNLTSQEMELEYAPSKRMLVEAQESCRVPVPIDRCPLSKLSNFYDEGDRSLRTLMDVNKICSEHISDQAKLKWLLNTTDAKGVASLKGITLSSRMLDIVRMSPLDWDVRINGDTVTAQDDISCEAGDSLELQMSIGNSLGISIKDLTLSIQFYQDYNNGTLNYRMDTRLALSGTAKKVLPSLDPRDVAKHKCNVVFFTPGLYKMDIQCHSPDGSVHTTGQLIPMGHIWKFTPPISIQVK